LKVLPTTKCQVVVETSLEGPREERVDITRDDVVADIAQ
jgi:hypothetical protein